jgi:hypothetical protein
MLFSNWQYKQCALWLMNCPGLPAKECPILNCAKKSERPKNIIFLAISTKEGEGMVTKTNTCFSGDFGII